MKHASSRLFDHGRSKDPTNAMVALARRAKKADRMEFELAQQTDQAAMYWNCVLKRLVSGITFACKRGLALRGENEMLGSAANGNYLGTLRLVTENDDFPKQHNQKPISEATIRTICPQQFVKNLCNSWENVYWMRSFRASNIPDTTRLRLIP